MINNVVLIGRLTKDIDLKYTANGLAVTSFTVAVNRNFTNQAGNREADFINCVAWRKTAENLANYTRKGSLIGVNGRLQTRSFDNQQGQKVYITEVVADEIQFLESKNNQENSNSNNTMSNTHSSYQEYKNTQTQSLTDDLFIGSLPYGDDLPF